jgi:hypothetical protein
MLRGRTGVFFQKDHATSRRHTKSRQLSPTVLMRQAVGEQLLGHSALPAIYNKPFLFSLMTLTASNADSSVYGSYPSRVLHKGKLLSQTENNSRSDEIDPDNTGNLKKSNVDPGNKERTDQRRGRKTFPDCTGPFLAVLARIQSCCRPGASNVPNILKNKMLMGMVQRQESPAWAA